jgi:hypothetical protein
MLPDIATTAVERTPEARQLIESAQAAPFVELVTVTALELCVLGGAQQPLLEESVADAWRELSGRRRRKLVELTTPAMVDRGLLTEIGPQPDGVTYALQPTLGVALAARFRPAFIVITETAQASLRTPRLFALGDEEVPVRAVVVEEPAALPAASAEFPHVKKLGLLGRFYRYVLVSPDRAAQVLAEWAIKPPPPPGPGAEEVAARRVSLFRHRELHIAGRRVIVAGDGSTARLLAPGAGAGAAVYDQAGLTEVMRDLMTGQLQ